MAQVAVLQDFRGQGAPADIGTFVMPCSVVIYQARFGGTTYVCAARQGERGWVLISYLPLTGANATTVINAALAALTAGRTWKETVVVIGNYVDLGTINAPSYVLLMIQGSWRLEANHAGSWLVNAAGVAGNVWIEICGGKLDGNQANQVSGGNVINFRMSDDCWVHHMEIICAFRISATAEGVYEGTGVQFAGNGAGGAGSYRGIVAYCRIRQMMKDGVQFERAPEGIVYSCTFVTTVSGAWGTGAVQFAMQANNGVCMMCNCDMTSTVNTAGYKIHGSTECVFAFNVAQNAITGIWLNCTNDPCNNNGIIGNRIIGPGLQGRGISISGPITSYRNQIMNNSIRGHTVGIYSDGSAATMYGTIVTGNNILGVSNAAENGIVFHTTLHGLIKGNRIELIGLQPTTASAAIRLMGGCAHCFIIGNQTVECPYSLRTDTSPYPTYCVWAENYGIYTGAGSTPFMALNGGSYHIVARNTAVDFQYGINVDTGIDYVWIYCNHILLNGGYAFRHDTAGSNIYIYLNQGYVTENVLLSGTFAIDAVGIKTIVVTHGLGDPAHAINVLPSKQDFQLTVVEETDVDDWGFNLLKVDAVSNTQVTIKINVSVASATAGATARIGILVWTGLPNRPGGFVP